MPFMQANPLLGQAGGGWALEISTFLDPKWRLPDGSMPFHSAQKRLNIQGQPPPTCPRNGCTSLQYLWSQISSFMRHTVFTVDIGVLLKQAKYKYLVKAVCRLPRRRPHRGSRRCCAGQAAALRGSGCGSPPHALHTLTKKEALDIWIRIRRIRMFLGLPGPHPDSLVTSTDPGKILPSSCKNSKKNLDFSWFVTSSWLFKSVPDPRPDP